MEKVIEKRQEVIDFLRVDECIDGKVYEFTYDNGCSDGKGYGNKYVDGNGEGIELGNGYGEGSGVGSGDIGGSGIGYALWTIKHTGYEDIKVVNGMIIHIIDYIPTLIDSVHGNFAKGYIFEFDLSIKPCYIAKYCNCFAHGETLEDAFIDAREKYEESLPIEERIARFNVQYPNRNKKVPANELFKWHHILTGSCLMGRKQFCKERGIDYENGEYSVNEFIQLTKNAYNGYIIRQLESSL